jgi:23S rRNA (adenine2503-C2)-methyltransferase
MEIISGIISFVLHIDTHLGEIIAQYLTVMNFLKENNLLESDRVSNIVFMGQGEPLHNFENVKSAITNLLETRGIGIGQRRITLSTSGYVPQLTNLVDFPPVNIAISLHSARNEVRDLLMPINKVFDLEKLFEAIKSVPLKAYRRITYEYLLIDNVNDTLEDIEALSRLLYRKESKINLIPFNEYPGSEFKRPSPEKVEWFCRQLLAKNFICTVRQSKGGDILAACGQLKTQKEKINSW